MVKLASVTTFDFDNVRLLPREGVLESRSQASTETVLNGYSFKLPVVPANMSTVISEELSEYLASGGYFYVMHRFNVDMIEFTKRMHAKNLIASISLGIQEKDYEIVEKLAELSRAPEFITIDVAHGFTRNVAMMIKKVREKLPEAFVIAGNVASEEGALFLVEAGAQAVKVGVGPGKVCVTSPNTGFGTKDWQLSAVKAVAEALDSSGAIVISDGGIREYGDITKAIVFGADLVMAGGLLAGHEENPGEQVIDNGVLVKEFFGSASEFQKGDNKHVEGARILVPFKGSIDNTLRIIRENLQSSISYSGGRLLEDLRNVSYVLVP